MGGFPVRLGGSDVRRGFFRGDPKGRVGRYSAPDSLFPRAPGGALEGGSDDAADKGDQNPKSAGTCGLKPNNDRVKENGVDTSESCRLLFEDAVHSLTTSSMVAPVSSNCSLLSSWQEK